MGYLSNCCLENFSWEAERKAGGEMKCFKDSLKSALIDSTHHKVDFCIGQISLHYRTRDGVIFAEHSKHLTAQ